MSKNPKAPKLLSVLHTLATSPEARPRPANGTDLDPQLASLKRWQAGRLRRTYADMLADPRYTAACEFFLSDIYAARDFSQRDQDAEHLHDLLARFLPAQMLRLLAEANALNRMTGDLDRALSQALGAILAPGEAITPQAYAAGYRACRNYEQRVDQITRTARILDEVGKGARLPLVGATLKLARVPALRAGWFDLYDFLVRGYQAFRPMKDVPGFVNAIEQRELDILNRIFAGENDPFPEIETQ